MVCWHEGLNWRVGHVNVIVCLSPSTVGEKSIFLLAPHLEAYAEVTHGDCGTHAGGNNLEMGYSSMTHKARPTTSGSSGSHQE